MEKEREGKEYGSLLKTRPQDFSGPTPLALSLPTPSGRLTRKDFMVRFAPILEATHET